MEWRKEDLSRNMFTSQAHRDGRVSRVLRARGTSAARFGSIMSSLVAVKIFDNTVVVSFGARGSIGCWWRRRSVGSGSRSSLRLRGRWLGGAIDQNYDILKEKKGLVEDAKKLHAKQDCARSSTH